jgi:regulator of RNase E activity RraA
VYRRLGAVGVVTDAANRDQLTIQQRAPGFQVFSPGWVVSHGNGGTILDIGLMVIIAGLPIAHGSLLHGDANGLLTVPLGIAASVAEEASRVRETERQTFELLDQQPIRMETIKAHFRH